MQHSAGQAGLWHPDHMASIVEQIRSADPIRYFGELSSCTATQAQIRGLSRHASVGDGCWFDTDKGQILGEIVSLADDQVHVSAYEELTGQNLGARVWLDKDAQRIYPTRHWRGRVIDALARPIDDRGPLPKGHKSYSLYASPPPPQDRGKLGPRLPLGVRAMDLFTPCCEGQRLGVFAGSGVGKSSLISMIASQSKADVIVVGLIGERGRELNEFLSETLGPRGLARSVVIAATSDTSAMMRRRAAYLTMTVAECFRDQGLRVLCLLDSVTRFAMALREIFLAAGEPPTSKGYPPAVFAELPKLLERAGPAGGSGSITGLFSVLVEGDDTNEPVADTVRGILDGHIIMDRNLAERGRYPAIDILKSVSRSAPGCYAQQEWELVQQARSHLREFANMQELIELGAYKHGSNPKLDEAIARQPFYEQILSQNVFEPQSSVDPFAQLEQAVCGQVN